MNIRRILLVGDANSFLLNDIALNIHNHSNNIQIDILNTNPTLDVLDKTIYSKILKPNVFRFGTQKLISQINQYPAFFSMRFCIKSILKNIDKKYDVVHLHFFNKNFFYIDISYFKKISDKLLITFWGSDFFKRTDLQKNKMIPYLDAADQIIFANPLMQQNFLNHFNNYHHKTNILPFGLDIFNSIDNLINDPNTSKEHIKKELGFDSKTVISIGYSSHPEQHQIEILQDIVQNIDKDTLQNIHFVLPLTYGDAEYTKRIIGTANALDLNYTALTSRMTKEAIAKVRYASDIMVHLRDTDQFSGSFQEYLYTRNVVITGTWLPFGFLSEDGLFLHTINKRSELFPLLKNVLCDIDSEYKKTEENPKILAKYSHWNMLIEKHISLYI
ncbi:MAG: glycosyltransferase [Bacteroidales bacterium]